MIKKHIVLFETKEYEWVAYSTAGSNAKRILNVNKNYNIFYIFECDLLKQYPYIMKLKAPLNKYYDCTYKLNTLTYKLDQETIQWIEAYINLKLIDVSDDRTKILINEFIYSI